MADRPKLGESGIIKWMITTRQNEQQDTRKTWMSVYSWIYNSCTSLPWDIDDSDKNKFIKVLKNEYKQACQYYGSLHGNNGEKYAKGLFDYPIRHLYTLNENDV